MDAYVPILLLTLLGLAAAAIGCWAVREVIGFWSGRGQAGGGGGGQAIIGAMAEIQRIMEPSIVHVEQVDEEAETEQDQDGD